jgi:hypothetical protein
MADIEREVRDEGHGVRVTGGGKEACDRVRNAMTASELNLANVSRRRPKHLDRELMILWLQQRKAAGQSLRWTVVCLENRDHALAIRREFGNCGKGSMRPGGGRADKEKTIV